MVNFNDSGGENFTINLLDAINIIHMASQKLSKETILNCFTHEGFLEVEDHFDPVDDLPLIEWMKKIQQEDDLRDNIRAGLPYTAIFSAVDTDDDGEKENKDEESVDMELIPTPTTSEALRHIDSVRHFLQSRNTLRSVLDRLAEVQLHINDTDFTKINQNNLSQLSVLLKERVMGSERVTRPMMRLLEVRPKQQSFNATVDGCLVILSRIWCGMHQLVRLDIRECDPVPVSEARAELERRQAEVSAEILYRPRPRKGRMTRPSTGYIGGTGYGATQQQPALSFNNASSNYAEAGAHEYGVTLDGVVVAKTLGHQNSPMLPK
ncbi:unnamed protein product [Acanthoscelides obtectus]|uniref:Uncharacterized protein n=1 Tax=Acanthoscelides obtectus TaxID=200917 RepID=A0A9P0PL26_ACAOB|nr:unnamed protein product [Acanthoscelides obtectus]CAK1636341.1 hypothetical protein AOBTE_LOCUS9814 [Acanthoscelides obtectus]